MKNLEQVQQAVEASLRELAQAAEAPSSTQERELSHTLQVLSDRLKHILSSSDSIVPSETVLARADVVSPTEPSQKVGECPTFYFLTSPEGIILTACGVACEVLGLEWHQLGTMSLKELIPDEEWKAISQILQRVEDIPASTFRGMTMKTASGQNQRMRVTIMPLWDQGRQVSSWAWNVVMLEALLPTESANALMEDSVAKLVEGESLESCLSQICQWLVTNLGISFVWIAACEEGKKTLSLLTHAESIEMDWSEFGPMWWKTFTETRPMSHIPSGMDLIHGSKSNSDLRKISWVPSALESKDYLIMPLWHGSVTCGVFVLVFDHALFVDKPWNAWLRWLRAQILNLVVCAKRLEDMRLHGAAMDSVSYAVCVVDLKGCLRWVNEAYTKMIGQPLDTTLGTPFRTFPREQLQALQGSPDSAEFAAGCVKTDVQEKLANGDVIDLEQVVTPVVNQEGEITHYVAILQDITGKKSAEAEMKHLAYHDPLTDLPNRVMFEDRLQQALAQTRRQGGLLAVLFLDLDNFKPINDHYGHRMGDRLLRIVAKRLVTCVRSTDTVARLSGDEFTIILQGLDRIRDIRQVTQKILDCLVPPIRLNGHNITIKVSIGIAVYPNDATHPTQLLEIADHAMYQAKEQGGQRWVFATPAWNVE